MDIDDLDDSVQVPSRSRPSRFAPKSSHFKPQPRSEFQAPTPKSGAQDVEAPVSKAVEGKEDSEPQVFSVPKAEASDSKGTVKMEVDAKSEPEEDKMDEDDDEDTVIREIDVYLTPSLESNTQLYVLQYPLRPSWRPYGLDERCEEVRVKPISSEVEVDLSVDVDSKNYDNDCSSSVKMAKQILKCSWKPPPSSGNAVGVLIGNKLHLNPIHAVVQLRPSMEHLKFGGSKRKNSIIGDAEESSKLEESNEGKSVDPSKKQNKQMESSTELKTDKEECWVQLKYHGPKSDLAAKYLSAMVEGEGSTIQFTMNPYDYLNSLCPGACNNIKPKGPSRRHLLSVALEERIKILLCEGAQVHRFSVLKHFAPDDSDEDVLGVLQLHALLVQGLWVPKSSLLLSDSGLQPLARDYTLLLFSKNPVISFSQLDVPATLSKVVKVFLKTLAIERPSFKDWKFREHTDVSFIKQYPDIVKNQEQVWKSIENKLISVIHKGGKSGPGLKNAIPKPSMVGRPEKSLNPDKGAPKNSIVHNRTMSDETREAIPKALLKVFQNYKVCSLSLIRQGLRGLAVSQNNLPKVHDRIYVAAALGVEAPEDELKEVISQVAMDVNELYVLKSSSEHPEYDPLRNVVIGLLKDNGPNAKLKKGDIFAAAEHTLKRKITNNEYVKSNGISPTDACREQKLHIRISFPQNASNSGWAGIPLEASSTLNLRVSLAGEQVFGVLTEFGGAVVQARGILEGALKGENLFSKNDHFPSRPHGPAHRKETKNPGFSGGRKRAQTLPLSEPSSSEFGQQQAHGPGDFTKKHNVG